ncbi:hypothetical protein AB0876_28805 [Mycobacterium sp. NPDC049093]
MPDWTGTTVYLDALKVPCPDCHVAADTPCVRFDGKPLEKFPAHIRRITASRRTA